MALKPFWNKKLHLGLTSKEAKAGIKAGASIPVIQEGDAGKAILVNSDADGFELAEVGGVTTEVVEITAEEALDIYNDNTVEKTLTIQDVPNIFAVKTPDGNMMLCYDSLIRSDMHIYRSIAGADLNIECTYYTATGKIYIGKRNVV